MQPHPLIAVRDVESSSRWYQHLLDCESGHGGREYERLNYNGRLVLQLHDWHAHEHPHLGDVNSKPYGNGVVLWFETENFDAAVDRVRSLGAEILQGPEENPGGILRWIWLRDPDGYVIVLASALGDVG